MSIRDAGSLQSMRSIKSRSDASQSSGIRGLGILVTDPTNSCHLDDVHTPFFHDSSVQLDNICIIERQSAGQHAVKRDSKSPDIHCLPM